MDRYISLLRGVNLGSHNKVNMLRLKQVYEDLGFKRVETFIQSGNVLFESPEKNLTKLILKIEDKIAKEFGFEVPVFIRTRVELQKLIRNNPFAGKDPAATYVTFLSNRLKEVSIAEIEKVKGENERYYIDDREIYLYYPDGYGRTKLSNNFFEKKLKVEATTRNWKTVNALFNMA